MSDGWHYELTPRASRDIVGLRPEERQRIFEALDHLVTNPLQGDRRKLQGQQNEWRLRVGEYRVIFGVDRSNQTFVIFHIGHRRDIYRRR